MSRLRAAVVGAGLMGRWHAHAICRAGGQVAVIVDRDAPRASALAAVYKARHAASMDDVLAAVDVVHVCTPTASHEPLIAEALNGGRHVLAEKPLASSAAETRRLLEIARTRGVLLCPVHQYPFQPGVARIVAALPTLAPIRHIDVTMCSAGAASAGAADADTVALEILPHPLSVLARIAPEILRSPWAVHQVATGEYRLTAAAEGVSASVVISMTGRPTVNTLRLIAVRGTAHANLFHGYAVFEDEVVSRTRKVTQPFLLALSTVTAAVANLGKRALSRQPAYPGLIELTRLFYSAAMHGGPGPIAVDEVFAIAETMDEIRQRTHTGHLATHSRF